MTAEPRLGRRALVLAGLVAVALALDGVAWGVLRTATGYDHWAEMREMLATAKFLGSGFGTALIALVVGWLDRRQRAFALVVVVLAAAAAAGAAKVLAGRERPSHLSQPPGQARRWSFHGPVEGLTHSTHQSFPSGHTATAVASATALGAMYPPARPVFWVVAGACGVHRVVKHQHFLSDAVAGAAIGHLVGVWVLSRRRIRRWWVPGGRSDALAENDIDTSGSPT